MVHGRLFVFQHCVCLKHILNKTKRESLPKSFSHSTNGFRDFFYIKQESRIVKALNKTYIEIGLYIKNFIAIFVVVAVSWYNH